MFSRAFPIFSQDGFSSRAGLMAVLTLAVAGMNIDVDSETSPLTVARVTVKFLVRLLKCKTRDCVKVISVIA